MVKDRMVDIVDRLVDALVHLVSETVSPVNGRVVLQCGEEEEGSKVNSGNFEVVVDELIPTEGSGEAKITFKALDCELDAGVNPATHAVTSRGRIRRFAAAVWRGVKLAVRMVLCCDSY